MPRFPTFFLRHNTWKALRLRWPTSDIQSHVLARGSCFRYKNGVGDYVGPLNDCHPSLPGDIATTWSGRRHWWGVQCLICWTDRPDRIRLEVSRRRSCQGTFLLWRPCVRLPTRVIICLEKGACSCNGMNSQAPRLPTPLGPSMYLRCLLSLNLRLSYHHHFGNSRVACVSFFGMMVIGKP
jgi:hypothetical protein